MLRRHESEYVRAKTRAAHSINRGWDHPADLPTDREIRDELEQMIHRRHAEGTGDELRLERLEALRLMRVLRAFRPIIVGRLLRDDADGPIAADALAARVHVFAGSVDEVLHELEQVNTPYDIEKQSRSGDGDAHNGVTPRILVRGLSRLEIVVHSDETSIFTHDDAEAAELAAWADLVEFERLLVERYADITLGAELLEPADEDRFEVYRMLLAPLEHVRQNRERHPEGDALCHSLQVFDLARHHLPYDEEFLLAALLHDVGKGIDRHDHVRAGLAALGPYITPRTSWLIEHHSDANALRDGKLGARSRRRLEAAESFEELMLLSQCDREGRASDVVVPELDDAIDYLRELADACGE